MIYVVIDTNVLVSANISKQPQAATVRILAHLYKGDIRAVYNEDILKEYREVLHRAKFHLSEDDIEITLRYIEHFGLHSERIPYEGAMPDEKDRPFYEVSLSVDESYLVTGNIKHFPITPKVVSPAEIVEIIERKDAQ